jgi:hypothetical protein
MWGAADLASRGPPAPKRKLLHNRKDCGFEDKKGLFKFVFLVNVNRENSKQSLSAGVVTQFRGDAPALFNTEVEFETAGKIHDPAESPPKEE